MLKEVEAQRVALRKLSRELTVAVTEFEQETGIQLDALRLREARTLGSHRMVVEVFKVPLSSED